MSTRRRVLAARTRRKRLLRVDIVLALLLAIVAIALAPGLAMVAVIALVVLLLCGLSLAFERLLGSQLATIVKKSRR